MVAPVFNVTLWFARMLPLNAVVVPSVAELPTWKNTLGPNRPPRPRTDEPLAVVRVLPIWNTNWEAEFPRKSRKRFPVSWADDWNRYTPGVRVIPPRS